MQKFNEMTAAEIVKAAVKFWAQKEEAGHDKLAFNLIKAATVWENVTEMYVNNYRRAQFAKQTHYSLDYCEPIQASENRSAVELLHKVLNHAIDSAYHEYMEFVKEFAPMKDYDDEASFTRFLESLCPYPYAEADNRESDEN